MRFVALAFVVLLAACLPPQQQGASADPTPASVQASSPASPALAPSPAATPVDCQDEQSGGYGNAKECYYATCKQGDAEACRMAESFNGNLFPEGDPNAVRLVDMTYPEAREVIVGMGWIPAGNGSCSGWVPGDNTCADFPEIDDCSGTGMGYCAMTFLRGDRCLDVLTIEGRPKRGVTDSPFVNDVSFRKGPCGTEPKRR